MTDGIEDLQVRLAFHEHHLAELDAVIRELRDQVDRLREEVRELREQRPMGDEDPDQKPPHY